MILNRSDAELMDEYLRGSEDAFSELYRRHSGKVYGYLRGRLSDPRAVDDLFQAVFLRIHQARTRYDSKFPFEAWLFTICRNILIDHFRRQGRSAQEVEESLAESQSALWHQEALERHDAEETTAGDLDLSLLSKDQRKAVELRYFSELSFEQIAERLDTSPANARQLISRAVKRLKAKYGRQG